MDAQMIQEFEVALDAVLLLPGTTGATVWAKGRNYSEGYVVAYAAHEGVFVTAEYIGDYERLIELVLAHVATMGDILDGQGIGLWLHQGRLYVDKVAHYIGVDQAYCWAKQEHQLAFYDITNNREVTL